MPDYYSPSSLPLFSVRHAQKGIALVRDIGDKPAIFTSANFVPNDIYGNVTGIMAWRDRIKKVALFGDGKALVAVGEDIERGDSGDDLLEAIEYYNKAILRGSARGNFAVGRVYYEKSEMFKDKESVKAGGLARIKSAAELGDDMAIEWLRDNRHE